MNVVVSIGETERRHSGYSKGVGHIHIYLGREAALINHPTAPQNRRTAGLATHLGMCILTFTSAFSGFVQFMRRFDIFLSGHRDPSPAETRQSGRRA
jgi:hypothetical protein